MNVLDLFSGIGGFSLGLERAGFTTVAFCECEPYARRVLAKHWPDVPCYEDVRTLTAAQLAADGIGVDVICGGFPCQDISTAGSGAGLDGERSGLYREVIRLAGELRPRYIVLENVAALLSRGLGRVLGDLAEVGYDTEWHCIPAFAVGAPHRRDRIWIVAYPSSQSGNGGTDHPSERMEGQPQSEPRDNRGAKALAETHGKRLEGQRADRDPQGWQGPILGSAGLRDGASNGRGWWLTEPNVGRVANGVPARVDRLRCLGNAVVPQIPELIGRAIMRATVEAAGSP